MIGPEALPSIVVRRAEVAGALVDVSCADGVVTDVSDSRAGRAGADIEVDAAGGALVPGLHDHHIHLLALAAARASLSVAPPEVQDDRAFDGVLSSASGVDDAHEWLRVVGFHEFHAGPLDRDRLDALAPSRPVRVQHATGAMWVLNSRALALTGIEHLEMEGIERDDHGRATGRLFGLDELLRGRVPPTPLDLPSLGRELAAYGVTGVTDLTPTNDADDVELLARQVTAPGFPIEVTITGGLDLPPTAAPELGRGPVKVVIADHALPTITELSTAIERAHRRGRNVALHCASRVAVVLATASWEQASVRDGDRIEHGSAIPIELIPSLAELGLIVVTQPSFVVDRGDRYLRDVPTEEHADLWRCGSLLRGGVRLAAGTDAPYGDPDPWRAIVAASERTTSAGRPLGRTERVEPRSAFAMFQTSPDHPAGRARQVAVGAAVRLCLLDRPLDEALRLPTSSAVRATITPNGVVTRPA